MVTVPRPAPTPCLNREHIREEDEYCDNSSTHMSALLFYKVSWYSNNDAPFIENM